VPRWLSLVDVSRHQRASAS